ncbi:MAG TPA: sn-glycerol-3-phosphate ABC transporter ATP-binding protein UgpC [Geminicoccus sp.]|jgi:ABC-type sugar transport system ATPase subunit|uniref:ABC transporter ATP-binding protein n=1 Tax=Geminicoccus sp. TaxID=2024832 RepID=UPI002E373A13|nr:sn-glycerol-3-phosphate ABC transporter ATP-binding protein UgpC [Geminicoccus sp.]HEX2527159.1 sn-glycerol-3-phosphate ABC transporter ATP-binding protein UgpC [Geminicoccus sp.]
MTEIRLANVTKTYPGGQTAVDKVDLTIKDGEFFVLLGPSGCGKSTTLRMIAGLEPISGGDLFIGDRRMNEVDPKDRDLAFVFQNYALFPHLTVRGNLTFGMRLRGVPAETQQSRLAEVTGMLGLGPYLERKPGQLSGGQRQRVALGRALLRDPVAFLLDEPLSNLDAKLRAQMRTELVKLHRRVGRTIIHVTHDQIEAMTMAERICIMNNGKVAQIGAPMEVYRNPADTFVATFTGSPPMNLLEGRLDNGMLTFAQTSAPVQAAAPAGPVTIGFRPEDAVLAPRPGHLPLQATVVAVETLGADAILVASLQDGQEVNMRVGADTSLPAGAAISVYLDSERLRLFDPKTTLAVPCRLAA